MSGIRRKGVGGKGVSGVCHRFHRVICQEEEEITKQKECLLKLFYISPKTV